MKKTILKLTTILALSSTIVIPSHAIDFKETGHHVQKLIRQFEQPSIKEYKRTTVEKSLFGNLGQIKSNFTPQTRTKTESVKEINAPTTLGVKALRSRFEPTHQATIDLTQENQVRAVTKTDMPKIFTVKVEEIPAVETHTLNIVDFLEAKPLTLSPVTVGEFEKTYTINTHEVPKVEEFETYTINTHEVPKVEEFETYTINTHEVPKVEEFETYTLSLINAPVQENLSQEEILWSPDGQLKIFVSMLDDEGQLSLGKFPKQTQKLFEDGELRLKLPAGYALDLTKMSKNGTPKLVKKPTVISTDYTEDKDVSDAQNVELTPAATLVDEIKGFNLRNLRKVDTDDRSKPAFTNELSAKLNEFFNNGELKHVSTDDRSAPILQEDSKPKTQLASALNDFFQQSKKLNQVETNDRSAPMFDQNDMKVDNQLKIGLTLKGEKAAKEHQVTKNELAGPVVKKKVRFLDEVTNGDEKRLELVRQKIEGRDLSLFDKLEAERQRKQKEWLGLPDPEKM